MAVVVVEFSNGGYKIKISGNDIQISSGKITSSISVQGGLDGADLSKDILDFKIQSSKSEKKNGKWLLFIA